MPVFVGINNFLLLKTPGEAALPARLIFELLKSPCPILKNFRKTAVPGFWSRVLGFQRAAG
jgi:hypothetical protein